MDLEQLKVELELLNKTCDLSCVQFETTDEVPPLSGTIGQERAIQALELGLDIEDRGFNIYVSGPPGTGRNTALTALVRRVADMKPVPAEWGYIYNFKDPFQPVAISLPNGKMNQLKADMAELVESCKRDIPKAFESQDYSHRIEDVMKDIQAKRQEYTGVMEKLAQEAGFALSTGPAGITPIPLTENRPMTREEYEALSKEVREDLNRKAEELQRSLSHVLINLRQLGKQAQEQVREVDKEIVRFTTAPIIRDFKDKYKDYADVVSYLDMVEGDLIDNVDVLKPKEEAPQSPGPFGVFPLEDFFIRYQVNDLVDNTTCSGAPVIFENSPTYYNLFGRIDYRARVGTFTTDLTMIKAGSIHRANGGYLVLQARDVLTNPLSWDTLKRSLRSREVRIENIGEQYSPLPSTTLRPQPIPIKVKVILVGSPDLLRLLQIYDEDFRRLFKITADFDTVMDRTEGNMAKYAAFVARQVKDGGLRPFHKTAVAKIIDYSSRLVEDQNKLTTRFMMVSDIITEANYWAGVDKSPLVQRNHVEKAIEQRKYRSSLIEDRLQELIDEGTIHIATEGGVVGQVNGLAVLAVGDYMFGKPNRITARVSVGRGQITNIDRETRLSGPIHDKGFMILTGYLQGKYGHDKPLSLSASLTFEQSYSEIEGDSASSTELYALLSELAGIPINQGIAVTGSVNQAGEVQAIGGATYKIEGFYDVCKAKGPLKGQGVIVPKDNLRNLFLNDEVVQAVREGKFNIYAVSTIDEGIEVLTGVPAGTRKADGTYPEGTVHYLVERRLWEMAKKAREYGRALDKELDGAGDKKPAPPPPPVPDKPTPD